MAAQSTDAQRADLMPGDCLPLRGLRVVDTTDRTAWTGGRLLADLGADVILVDPPDAVADALYVTRNVNKRSVTLPEPALRRLLDHADVWIDCGGFNLDVAAVHRDLPGLVIVSILPFGTTGPYKDKVATDPVLFAMSGILSRCRSGERPPLLPPGRMASEGAGAMAAYLALVGLWNRFATGEGDRVEISSLENLIQCSDTAVVGASASLGTGSAQSRGSYPCYPTADGFVKPILTTPRHWQAVKDWFGDPPELEGEELYTLPGRAEALDRIGPHYEQLFAPMTAEGASIEGQRRGVPTAPVWDVSALLASDGMRARQTFVPAVLHGREGLQPSGFYFLDGERVGPRRPTVVPGEATGAVLSALERSESPFVDRADHLSIPLARPADERPLAGLRVLLFGVLMAGPEIAKLFSDQGADVIRVESSTYPDSGRLFGGAAGLSSQFVTMNRNARSFGVDVKSEQGRELVLRIVSQSHVLIENMGPGALDGLGLTADALTQANPDLVRASTQLFGDASAWGQWRGYGNHARGLGAMTWLWRYPDSETAFADDDVFFPDQFNGRIGAAAVMACLLAGGGRRIQISQTDAVINSLAELMLSESLEPGSVRPTGNRSDQGVPWGVFRCRGDDQWCVITIEDDEQWAGFAERVGEVWAKDERWTSAARRHARVDELNDLVTDWTMVRTPAEIVETLQGAQVPAAWVVPTSELLHDPHLQARDFLRLHLQPGFNPLFLEGDSWHAERMPQSPLRPAPALGQDTRNIASEILGLTAVEVDNLLQQGVLEINNPPDD